MKHESEKSIGIFDSGVGGLTVYRELAKLLPNEKLIYLGDTARVPYGTKSSDVVLKYALQDSLFLLDKGVKLIVIACNTASAFALPYLQERLKVPVVGVIEPGAWAAMSATKTKRIGIIGTEGTIRSQAYEKALKQINKDVFCVAKATNLFVPIIEEFLLNSEVLTPLFNHYLADFHKHNIDTLILGCTHYPLLSSYLAEYFQGKINLVDSANSTAHAVFELLRAQNLANREPHPPDNRLYVTDAPERVERISREFLGDETIKIEKIDL